MDHARASVLDAYETIASDQLRMLQELVRIPCPPGLEGPVQSAIAQRMSDLGLSVELVPVDPQHLRAHETWSETGSDYSGRPNVVGVLRGDGGGRSLLLHAHADVAGIEPRELWSDDPWSGRVDGDRLYGRGAWDDKSGCAAILAIPRVLATAGITLRGDLILATTVDEEVGCNGALAVVDRGYRADGVAAVDGGGPGRPIVAFPGMIGFRITAYGRQAAYSQAEGNSAMDRGSQVVRALAELQRSLNTSVGLAWHGQAEPIDVVVSRIECGEWLSVTPGKCILDGFVTYVPPLTERDTRAALEQAVHEAAADPSGSVAPSRIEFRGLTFRPFDASSHDALLESLDRSHLVIQGGHVEKRAARAFNDVFQFSRHGSVPSCLISPGTGGNPHSADEYYDLSSMRPATRVLLAFVLDWCGVQH